MQDLGKISSLFDDKVAGDKNYSYTKKHPEKLSENGGVVFDLSDFRTNGFGFFDTNQEKKEEDDGHNAVNTGNFAVHGRDGR